MPRQVKLSRLHRVIDANYNRAKEGLRVCEDICRFVRDDAKATARFKELRHGLTAAVMVFGLKDMVASRDITGDVGCKTIAAESRRRHVGDIFYANIQRVKESLRVLEEFAKLENIEAAERFKSLRYKVYGLEKKAFERLQAVSDPRR